MYKFAGTDLSIFNFTPIVQDGSNLALSGFLDMPARLGKTFHDWANEDGVEPYVSANEIFYGGRDLNLSGVITGSSLYECNDKLAAMYSLVGSVTSLVPLATNWGTYNVYVNAPIVGAYLPTGGNLKGVRVAIPMREPVVTMDGTVPTGDSNEFGIDGISFASLGGAYLQLSGDRLNRTAPKKADLSVYGKEGYAITHLTAPELDLRLAIKTTTYAQLRAKVYGLMALLASPGMRTLTVNNDRLRSFFVKDGFKVSNLYVESDRAFCVIDCKLTESGVPGTFSSLVDSLGNIITDTDGNTIKILI